MANHLLVLFSFVFFTGLVALATWFFTRKEDTSSQNGFFLAGRSLTFPFIAGSLLLTNLSTEQMVGLNGDSFAFGLSEMVWEVVAVVALVAMALFFLPRYLKSGITTLPELLDIRYDSTTRVMCNLIFLVFYATILLPIILYTGAKGLSDMMDLKALTGIQNDTALLWMMVWLVGLIGSAYALFGGLRTVVVSDTFNGIGLLIGGLMITVFGLSFIGDGSGCLAGFSKMYHAIPERFNSIGGPKDQTPFLSIFAGVIIIHLFYWCTNQQIIQRTLAAKSLKEGQKGVLLCGALKLLGPLYLVLPGIMAYYILHHMNVDGFEIPGRVNAYGTLVRFVLPKPLVGFFAAVMVGAILSSFNSALNSTCTLFTLDIYKKYLRKDADNREIVRVGQIFGVVIAVIAMLVAPLLAGQDSIFGFLQKMNGFYSIPIFSIILMGLLNKRVPAKAANFTLIFGLAIIAFAYFVLPYLPEPIGVDITKVNGVNYYFLGVVFVLLMAIMLLWSVVSPRREGVWVQKDVGAVSLTPWRFAVPVGIALLILVIINYAVFADFSVWWK